MLQLMKITGAKPSKGELDNGRAYDSTKIYVETKMRDGIGAGYASTEYNWGTSENFDKIKGLDFPFDAEVDIELVTTGKVSSMIVLDVIPKIKPSTKTNI